MHTGFPVTHGALGDVQKLRGRRAVKAHLEVHRFEAIAKHGAGFPVFVVLSSVMSVLYTMYIMLSK
jgi:hypothetical protein